MGWIGSSQRNTTRRAGRPVGLRVFSTGIAAVTLLALGSYGVANAGLVAQPCVDPAVEPTVEEARLDLPLPDQSTPVGTEIIRRGGFTAMVADFADALCGLPDAATVNATVDRFGRSLWEAAVSRAQGPEPAPADALPASDDRPLYWTRLAMARALRQWTPQFSASQADRDGWQRRLEYASRGLTTGDFAAAQGVRKLFISGFDPFQLGFELRNGNPSGSAVLGLDGRVLTLDGVSVQVQAVVLPVRFADFTAGIVEDAFGRHVAAGAQGADMFTTISQGREGQFDLEVYNGRRRSTPAGDNLDVQGGGQFNSPIVIPGIGAGPEFIRSSLPLERMQAAGADGPYPVVINHRIVEIPAGSRTPRERFDGPTPGAAAVEGGGGGYLSNESAYRVTRLVTEAGRSLPAGHLHTPVLAFDQANGTEITDPTLAATRVAINDEVERILLAGATAPA